MVGLSVILEGSSSCTMRNQSCTSSQVVNKASMISIQSSPTSPTPSSPNPFSRKNNKQGFGNNGINGHVGFLHHCFLCKQNLMPGRDIFMYKGDRGFCSEECRYRQMVKDEDDGRRL